MIGHAVIATAAWCQGKEVCVGALYNHSISSIHVHGIYTYMINPNVFVFH